MRKLAAAVLAGFMLAALPAAPAHAEHIPFCHVGYHQVHRHGHWVCVKDHRAA